MYSAVRGTPSVFAQKPRHQLQCLSCLLLSAICCKSLQAMNQRSAYLDIDLQGLSLIVVAAFVKVASDGVYNRLGVDSACRRRGQQRTVWHAAAESEPGCSPLSSCPITEQICRLQCYIVTAGTISIHCT